MPNIEKIKTTMQSAGVSAETLSQFDVPANHAYNPKQIVPFINKMDELLTKEQCLSIMEQQGCNKVSANNAAIREFVKSCAGKSLEEKLTLLSESNVPHKVPCILNADGTLTVKFSHGIVDGKHKCGCSALKKLTKEVYIADVYCGCCGGHIRNTLENVLGIGLRLKDIISSPLSSHGEKPCELLFEVIE